MPPCFLRRATWGGADAPIGARMACPNSALRVWCRSLPRNLKMSRQCASTQSIPAGHAHACAAKPIRPKHSSRCRSPPRSSRLILRCSDPPVAALPGRALTVSACVDKCVRLFTRELAKLPTGDIARQPQGAKADAQHAADERALTLKELAHVLAAAPARDKGVPAVGSCAACALAALDAERRTTVQHAAQHALPLR